MLSFSIIIRGRFGMTQSVQSKPVLNVASGFTQKKAIISGRALQVTWHARVVRSPAKWDLMFALIVIGSSEEGEEE